MLLHVFSCAYWPFVYLLWRNVCSSSLTSFELLSLLPSCKSSLYILDINSLSGIGFANIFSHSVGCLFALLIVFFKNLFYFWLRWVFIAVRGLSLVVASGGYSSLRCAGFSLRWLLLLRSTGFSSCGSRALERRLSSCGARA